MPNSTQVNVTNREYNFAYIIDVSDSMKGEPLEAAKNAYINLTKSLIDSGIAEVSQFAVIPFGSDAFLNAPLNAVEAISTIENLSLNGFTNFNAALEKANQFFSTVPSGATNTVYFLSDGFSTTGGSFKNTAKALQAVADVQAYGFGAANIQELRIVDSDQPTIVSEVSKLADEFVNSTFSRDDIFENNNQDNLLNPVPQTIQLFPELDNQLPILNLTDSSTEEANTKINIIESPVNSTATEEKLAVSETANVEQTSPIVPQNAIQNIIDGNILNLEPFTGELAISFTVDREASFDNTVGFYKIEDAEGTITDPITGNKLKPIDGRAYAELAVKLHQPDIELRVDNLSSTIIQDTLSGGYLYAPFIIADGNLDTIKGDLSQVYFPFAQANSDGVEHIRSLGNNTLGFEDLFNGGDYDFNDMVISAEITMV
ncbi:MAG: DUF4114 domain-containing protein [Nostocales cyanobacterium 94392]|nr:DUF4114 domain-containing protein [Nostocales cyanobacterium 94392]